MALCFFSQAASLAQRQNDMEACYTDKELNIFKLGMVGKDFLWFFANKKRAESTQHTQPWLWTVSSKWWIYVKVRCIFFFKTNTVRKMFVSVTCVSPAEKCVHSLKTWLAMLARCRPCLPHHLWVECTQKIPPKRGRLDGRKMPWLWLVELKYMYLNVYLSKEHSYSSISIP